MGYLIRLVFLQCRAGLEATSRLCRTMDSKADQLETRSSPCDARMTLQQLGEEDSAQSLYRRSARIRHPHRPSALIRHPSRKLQHLQTPGASTWQRQRREK